MAKSLLPFVLPVALGATLTLTTTAGAVTSAELYRTVPETYGKFEARLQFAGGDGVIGSFFLWKDGSEMADVFWNELDFEKVGADCELHTNAFYGLPESVHDDKDYGLTGLCDGYHTYAYEWTPEYIAWFVDGAEIRRDTGAAAEAYAANATEGMQFRFNVWPGDASFGGTFTESILPVYEFVAWAQYSQYTPGTGDEGSDFTFAWREEFDALPADWTTATWGSPKGLSTHASQNVVFVDGVAVLALTLDDATGFVGTPPADGTASSTGGSSPTGGSDDDGGGCSFAPARSRNFPLGRIAGLLFAAAVALRRMVNRTPRTTQSGRLPASSRGLREPRSRSQRATVRYKAQGGFLAVAAFISVGGCSSEKGPAKGTGGAAAVGGTSNGGTSSGGTSTGGTLSTGGVTGVGGVATGGTSTGGVGVGGAATGGVGTGGVGTGGVGTGGVGTGGVATGGAGSGGTASDDPTVQLGDVRQMIRGFGINNNWQAIGDNASRLYGLDADGLGLNILRVGMGSNGEPYNGGSCYDDIDTVVTITAGRSEPHYIMGTLWSPPANCKTNNSIQNGGHLLTSCYESWSDTIAAFADKISQNTTTTLYAMSPQNETDFASCGLSEPCNGNYDTTLFTGKEAADFQKLVGPKLRAKGVVPMSAEASEWLHTWSNESACCSEPSGLPSSDPFDCGGFDGDPIAEHCTTDFGGYDYGHALAADPEAWAAFDILGTHQYDSQVAYPWPDDVPARGDKEVWQTEMSGVKWWPEQGPSSTIENGVAVARWVHSALVVAEANAWLWWWYSGTSTNEGLVLSGGQTAKRYYTFGNFTRYVRPGYHMVAVTGIFPDNVLVSAFQNDAGAVVIVAINETTSAQSIPVAFAGGAAPTTMTPIVTSATEDWGEGAPVAVTGGSLTMALEAMTVTTFVSQ